MKPLKKIRIVGRDRRELYISFLALLLPSPYYLVLPHGYNDSLIAVAAFSIALVCALNAVLDLRRMNWFEQIIAIPWFCFLAFMTPHLIWSVSQIEVFSNR